MSDVGLTADLNLDIAQALSQVDEVDKAITAAVTNASVSLDYADSVSGLADAITAAVTGTEATVPVDADVTGAEASIGALADQPPVDVPVDADVTGAVASIDAISTAVPPVTIEVDADITNASAAIADVGAEASGASGEAAGLGHSIEGIGAAAGIAEGSARELVGTLGEMGGEGAAGAAAGVLGLATATGAFYEEGLNAVSAGQRFDMTLGTMAESIKHIDVNGLHTDMETLGIQFGSTGAEMENVNSKLFQMAVNSGKSKEEASLFVQQIETLSARAKSLNPELGNLGDIASQMGDKIGRGGRFAQNLQITLTAAEIATRALADTGKTETSELTQVEKAMAGAELASEKYGDTLAGTVAEGSKNAAVQADSLKASFKEAIEQIGVPLVAPILDIIREVEPSAIAVAEALGRLAKDSLPAVQAALEVVGPLLQVVGYVLDQIPDGVIAATLAFFGLRFAMEAVAQAAIESEAALELLSTAIPWLAAITAGVILFQSVLGGSADVVDEATRGIDAAAKGFDDLTVSVADTAKAEVDAATATGAIADNMVKAGVSAEGLTMALIGGGDAWDQYRTQILAASSSFDDFITSAGELDHLRAQTEAAAKASLDKAVVDGKLTKAQEDQAISTAGLIEGQTNYAAALSSVQPQIAAQIEAEKNAKDAEDKATQAAKDHAAALAEIAAMSPAVAMTMENVQTNAGDETSALGGLALALGDAKLSTKDFDAVAADLGVTSQQLKAYVTDVTDVVNSFVTTATAGLPQVGDAIDRALDPEHHKRPAAIVLDPAALQAELDEDMNRINGFNMNIQVLIDGGFANLAKVAAQRGPEFAAALVKNLQNGGEDATRQLDAKFNEMNGLTAAEPDKLRTAGTEIATALGQVGGAATKEFGDKFKLEPTATGQVEQSRAAIAEKGIALINGANTIGAQASDEFFTGFGTIKAHTDAAMEGSVSAVSSAIPGLTTIAQAAGDAAHGGVQEGTDKIPGTTEDSIKAAGDSITTAAGPLRFIARIEGAGIGQAFDEGMKGGIDYYSAQVSAAASQVVTDAATAARKTSQAHSPSLLFHEIGAEISAGLALGIQSGHDDVVAAIGAPVVAGATLSRARVNLPVDRPMTADGSTGTWAADYPARAQGEAAMVFHIPALEPRATAGVVLETVAASRRFHTPRT